MLSKFESYIKDQFPYLIKEKSIVCCSGGVDSVVLFYLMLSVNKNFVVLVSVVAPYRDLREKFKKHNFVHEVFVHTTEIRGRENFFVSDYEKPKDDFLDIDTTNKSVEECVDEIFNVYR